MYLSSYTREEKEERYIPHAHHKKQLKVVELELLLYYVTNVTGKIVVNALGNSILSVMNGVSTRHCSIS